MNLPVTDGEKRGASDAWSGARKVTDETPMSNGPPALRRQTFGAVLGPLLFAILYVANPVGLPGDANSVLAGTVWIVVWWTTEPVHIAVTSLVPIPVFSLTGIVDAEAITAQYAHPIVFLLLGGFMLALAVERCELHRRIAVLFLERVGNAPARLLLGVMLASGFLSMWISNTATTMLLLPIAVAIAFAGTDSRSNGLETVDDGPETIDGGPDCRDAEVVGFDPDVRNHDEGIDDVTFGIEAGGQGNDDAIDVASNGFGLALLLGVAYGANVGGAATLIGSTPSAIFAGITSDQLGVSVGFVDWMLYAVPIVAVTLVVAWGVILRMTAPDVTIDEAAVDRYRNRLPELRADERRVVAVFGVVIAAWLARPFLIEPVVPALTDPVIAVIGGIALFFIPAGTEDGERLLEWENTVELPWGVLVLVGGSLAVAHAFQEGGLDEQVAVWLSGVGWMSLPALVLLVVAAVMVVSNVMSNTAAVTVLLPVLVSFAPLAAVPAVDLMAPVALAASFVFVLPVATPPNAIVYGSGHLDLKQMARVGIVLNLVCLPLVAVLSYVWLPLIQPFG